MAKQAKKINNAEYTAQPSPVSNKKTAKEIVKRHLKDKNDIITEEDMKSVQIVTGIAGENPLELSNKSTRPKDEEKDGQQITPWDTISE